MTSLSTLVIVIELYVSIGLSLRVFRIFSVFWPGYLQTQCEFKICGWGQVGTQPRMNQAFFYRLKALRAVRTGSTLKRDLMRISETNPSIYLSSFICRWMQSSVQILFSKFGTIAEFFFSAGRVFTFSWAADFVDIYTATLSYASL
jgi:hypothetical protein